MGLHRHVGRQGDVMRVALVRKSYCHHGGAERYVSSLLRRLVEHGVEVHIFANKWDVDPGMSDSVTLHRVPIIPGLSVLKVLSFAFFSMCMTRWGRFDIIHSFDKTLLQDIYRAGDGCHREWLRLRRQTVSIWKRLSIRCNPLHISLLAIERSLFRRGGYKKIIAASEMGKREIMFHYGVPEPDIEVIQNGVDPEVHGDENREERRRRLREKHGIPQDEKLLLFVGSGFERKGLATVIGAIHHLKQRKSRVRLAILGKGRTGRFRRMARESRIEELVYFLGVKEDVSDYYAASDIFALPSLYEPFGNAYLEAMASGVPVIVSAKSGASELIKDGENGLLLEDPLDALSLSRKIEQLMDPSTAARIGEAGRTRAIDLSWERNVEMTLKVYHDVLSDRAEAPSWVMSENRLSTDRGIPKRGSQKTPVAQ